MVSKEEINILSISGGGMRGVITIKELLHLEQKLKQPLHTYFDYISGTSTGGIIATLLTMGVPCKEILALYKKKGSYIFKRNFLRFGLFRPQYKEGNLNEVLRSYLGEAKMSDTLTNLIVPAYNFTKKNKKIFKSYRDVQSSLFDVVRATTSAPSFFKPHKIKGDLFTNVYLHKQNDNQVLHNKNISVCMGHIRTQNKKRDEALPVGESVTPEAQPIGSAVGG